MVYNFTVQMPKFPWMALHLLLLLACIVDLGPALLEEAIPRSTAHASLREQALQYAESLIGIPYGWWLGGVIPKVGPAWAKNAAAPALSEVNKTSVFCAGIPNLMLRKVILHP